MSDSILPEIPNVVDRLCARCQKAPARNKRGRPICVGCATHPKDSGIWLGPRVCGKCRERMAVNQMGHPRCDDCMVRPRQNPKGKMVICPSCERSWYSKRGYARCSSCRYIASKHPCASCGDPCASKATICSSCAAKAHPRGSQVWNWKGGRRITKRGYCLVKFWDHPRSGTDGYIYEHILIMEETLGRLLLPGETVHHKNGVRGDNRCQNLELWVISQPAGQRPEDLVKWAKEILVKYEELQ